MSKKRQLTQKQVAGMVGNKGLRTPPRILRQELGADRPAITTSIYSDEPDMFEDMIDEDECPVFDDMDGEEDGFDSDEL